MCDDETTVEDDQGGGAVLIRIHVPDLNIHKCLQFYRHDLIWDVKQQVLASLPRELKENFNYGLFAPPCNGKAGKFLDEERPLSDYPFSGPVGYVELRYKRRLFKGGNVDEKQLKSLHTKSNLRRFLEYVQAGNSEKVAKMCAKGLDSNFHCQDSGETPLSLAAVMKKPSKLLMVLVNGGALLDYRTKDGSTAMHRAVEHKSLEAVKTLLDLGGSPNYRDAKGLTPIYLSVALNAEPTLLEALLHDHGILGSQDSQGWHETHQACRSGLVQHLEHLLYYGANMNERNASGNTPLHVCAVNNQESCARLLLFRGADKEALNFANQTPYQVAVIAGNMELAEIIQNHRPQDVVPLRDPPKYNPKRRSVVSLRLSSDNRINGSLSSLSGRISRGPPSPCPSQRSLPPFSSASSCLSECSSHTQNSESCSDSSYSGGSHYGSEDNCGSSAFTEKSDIASDSSGVGTGSGSSYDATPTDATLILPGMMVIVVEDFQPPSPKHLKLTEGDIIEVTASTDTGLLEGSLRGQIGLFPSSVVQEIRMKVYENRNNHLAPPPTTRAQGRKEGKGNGNISRIKKMYGWGEPHTVVLHRGAKGFGFILRGAKADSPLMDLQPCDRFPALQYLDDVDQGGVADRAGLRKGDFLKMINTVDVSQSSHEVVVDLIRKSGDLVSLTVVGLSLPSAMHEQNSNPGSPSSLTCDQSSSGTPKAQSHYHFATLPRKYSGSNSGVPSPPKRDPTTSLSVGRARAKSIAIDLGISNHSGEGGVSVGGGKSNSVDSIAGKPPLPPNSNNNGTLNSSGQQQQQKTASIRARPTSSRITASEIHEIFAEKNGASEEPSSWTCPPSPLQSGSHKIYASVSEMKRSKSGLKGKELVKLHKDFHSTPDLKGFLLNQKKEKNSTSKGSEDTKSKSLSQDNLNKLKANARHSWACISSTAQNLLDRNYENSWKSIEKIPAKEKTKEKQDKEQKGEGEGTEGSSGGSDSETDSVAGKEQTPKSVKMPALSESEYRTIKKLRPVQSKTLPRRASTGCTIGPAEQQNIINLVPPGQVIKVDVSKSKEYASLDIASSTLGRNGREVGGGGVGIGGGGGGGAMPMSSFKPNDSAKLYASPDDLKSIGYREQGNESNNNSGTLKKIRSSQGKENNKGDYAQPDNASGKVINTNNTSNNFNRDVMPDLVNGNNASRNHDDSDQLTPTNSSMNNGNGSAACNMNIGPNSYNNSNNNNSMDNTDSHVRKISNEEQPFDPQKSLLEAKEKLKPVKPVLKCTTNTSSEATKIRIEVKQSPRLHRKVEKTVTFQSEPPQQSQNPSQSSQISHSMSVDEIQKIKTTLKSSKSFPNDLGNDQDGDGNNGGVNNSDGVNNSSSNNNFVTCLPVNPDSDSSEDSSDKTWILKDENGGGEAEQENQKPKIVPLQNVGNVHYIGPGGSLKRGVNDKVINTTLSNITPSTNTTTTTIVNDRPGMTSVKFHMSQQSSQQIQQMHQQQQHLPMDNATSNSILTYGTISRSQQQAVRNSGSSLTKNAVSVKIPPILEIESETEESKSPRDTPIQKKSVGSGPTGNNTMYHTLQPQRTRNTLTDQHQQYLMSRQQMQQIHTQTQGQSRQADKSIEESLKLIQMHVAALKQDFPTAQPGTQSPAPVPPPPAEFVLRNQTPILAPPPEFSDARDTHECATRFNQGNMYTNDPSQAAQMSQHFNRQSPLYRSINHSNSSSSMYSGYPTINNITRQQYNQQLHQHQMLQQQQQQQMLQQQQLQQSQSQSQQQQQAAFITNTMPNTYQTLGRHQSYSSSAAAQGVVNTTAYGRYGTLQNPKTSQQQKQQQQQQASPSSAAMFQQQQQQQQAHQHHPKCYYYQQTPSSSSTSTTNPTPSNPGGKYIPEKLHPVHRYTPDLVDNSGPRIVGTIPKKPVVVHEHYEVPQDVKAAQLLQQQQQQQQQAQRVRREFRNKSLQDWTQTDAMDWLDSLFLPEYKTLFQQRAIDGKKLMRIDNATLLDMGIKKLGHRMNIEQKLKLLKK